MKGPGTDTNIHDVIEHRKFYRRTTPEKAELERGSGCWGADPVERSPLPVPRDASKQVRETK
jgi:hypothetical protein